MKTVAHLIPWHIALVQDRATHGKRVLLHAPGVAQIIFCTGTVQAGRPGAIVDEDHTVAFSPPGTLEMRH